MGGSGREKLFKRMASPENLSLAWTRIRSGLSRQYKRHYRDLFDAYGLAEERNLDVLSKRLLGGSYSPSPPLRFYVPIPSGLHRPVTYLRLDDLIVYQAIANVVAEKIGPRRAEVEKTVVFSNLLNHDPASVFFFEDWRRSYQRFRQAIKRSYSRGAPWVGHFDLASYYDTIDHHVLVRQVTKARNSDLAALLCDCLREWTTARPDKPQHGLPQGPISSNFFAELYLLPVDKKLVGGDVQYLRYVDDIKILGRTREDVVLGARNLERECKERGLIPQSKKFQIARAQTPDEAVGKPPSLQGEEKHRLFTNDNEAFRIFKDAMDEASFDVSRVRYVLRASGRNDKILAMALDNLTQYPDLAEEFAAFLTNYRHDASVAQQIFVKILKRGYPLEYVEGVYWEALAGFRLPPLIRDQVVECAIARLKKNREPSALRLGIFKFLCGLGTGLVLAWLAKEPDSLLQSFAVPFVPERCWPQKQYQEFLAALLQRSCYEPALCAIGKLTYGLQAELLADLVPATNDASCVIANTLGVPSAIDPLGELLARRYGIDHCDSWQKLLGGDYDHANAVAFLADKSFYADRNAWLNYTDALNDVMVRYFIRLLSAKKPSVKWPSVEYGKGADKGKPLEYGKLLDRQNQLSKHYPVIVLGFGLLHDRRSGNPMSHAYNQKTSRPTEILRTGEQRELWRALCRSYDVLLEELRTLL